MKMTIGKKLAIVIIFLYPWLALVGIFGILGIESVGRSSYEIIDRSNFLINLQNFRIVMFRAEAALEQNDTQSFSAYIKVLKQQSEQAMFFVNERNFHLGNSFTKIKILKELSKQFSLYENMPLSEIDMTSAALALESLVKDTQEEFRSAALLPYRTQVVSIGGLGFITFAVIVLGGIVAFFVTRSIRRPLKQITNIASTISQFKGDLRQELGVDSSDEIGDLIRAFNLMTRNLAVLMGQIKDVSLQVVASSDRIKEVSQDQTGVALSQSSQVDAANSLIEKLRLLVKEIVKNVEVLFGNSEKAHDLAITGLDSVNRAKDGISSIKEKVDSVIKRSKILEEKSKSINKILSWIEEVSKKINILALNADIEASKIGADEGVSALSQEVRMLSDRSQQAASDIRNIVDEIYNEISNTVSFADNAIKEIKQDLNLVSESGSSMEGIKVIIDGIYKSSRHISGDTEKQEALSKEAVRFISHIQELSRNSLVHSQTIQELSFQIDSLSNQLKKAVGEFRT